MTWQPYIDQHLVGTGHVTKAAIFGHDGSLWAQSAGWLTDVKGAGAEAKLIAACCNETDNNFAEKGMIFNKTKYFFTSRPSGSSAAGKKAATGIVAVKTKKAVIIAYYDDKVQAGNCVNTALKIGDYLAGQNY